MSSEGHDCPDLSAVPLFPLPNVVLFPRAVLPLHVFEERYKELTIDAIETDRQIAMALLRAGWEKSYYGHPEIDPVVCVGTILSHERLADGKYNFLLQGHTRARVVEEDRSRSYRVARLIPLDSTRILEIDLEPERERLMRMFCESPLSLFGIAKQFRTMLKSAMSTPDIADLIAFTCLEDVATKQLLLAETDTRRRIEGLLAALSLLDPPPPEMTAVSSDQAGLN